MKYAKILLLAFILFAECSSARAECSAFIPNSALGKQELALTSTEFIPDTLNFGPVILFDSKTMGFTLKNTGTDTIFIVSYASSNLAEFSVTGPAQYFLYPDSSQSYSVIFSPQSHQVIHISDVIFTYGNSTTDTLFCFGYDHLPIHDTLAISRDYLVYADSDVTVSQELTASLAGALDSVRFFSEYIVFDPAVLEIVNVSNGANTPAPDWRFNTDPTIPGVVPVTATTTGYALQGPGEILRLTFHVFSAINTFQTSTVWDSGAVFEANPLEPVFSTDTGLVRVIDSCTVQMTDNAKPASAIEQNFPNPSSGRTTIAYSVGESVQSDSTIPQSAQPVSIFLYNSLGNLVRILVDENENEGRYEAETDVSNLSPGLYWYEFRTGITRELKPLVVAR